MSNFLETIRSQVTNRKGHTVWYGVPGAGKTSLLAQMAGSAFLSLAGDRGIDDLKEHGLVPQDYPSYVVPNWEQFLLAVQEWKSSPPPSGKLVIDNLSEAQSACRLHVLETSFGGDEATFNKYGDGWKQVAAEWDRFLNLIDEVRDCGVQVHSICHARNLRFDDPRVGAYTRWTLDLYDGEKANAPSLIHPTINRASEVFFLDFSVDPDKGKAKGDNNGTTRLLHVSRIASVEAKNRRGLTNSIDLGNQGPAHAVKQLMKAFSPKKGKDEQDG